MAKKNLAEAAAAILSGNMASLAPMSRVSEPFGSTGYNPSVATPGQEGHPALVQPAIASADEAGITKAIAAVGGAKPPGAQPAPASKESMKGASPQMEEEEEEEEDKKMMKEEEEEKEEEKEEKHSKKSKKKDDEDDEDSLTEASLTPGQLAARAFMKEKYGRGRVTFPRGPGYKNAIEHEDSEGTSHQHTYHPETGKLSSGSTKSSYYEEYSMKEDLDALFHGENLSEDFMNKAAVIFEAAVNAKAKEIEEQIQEQYAEILEQVSEQLKEEMTEKVDDYLNYVVEEWVKENELAIESGLRSELTEDFIAGLRNLFVEHYIDIPEEKVSVVEEMTAHVVELENKLNEQIAATIEINKNLNEYKKMEAIYDICEGLTATQIEKLKSLSEGIEFTSIEDFVDGLKTLRENYFPATVSSKSNNVRLDEETDVVEQAQSLAEQKQKENKTGADPVMDAYVKSISRTILK